MENPSSFDYFKYIKTFYERKDVYEYFDDFFKLVNLTNAKILDLGCGTGHVSKRLQRLGNHVISLDINPYLLAYGKLDNPILGNAYTLPLRDRSIDAVFFLDVIEHLDKPQVALEEIKRVLKIGGALYLITPNGLWSRLIFRGGKFDPTHVREYTWYEVKHLLEEYGFEIIFAIASGLPLLGRINPRFSRKIAKLLGKIALPISVPSFWIIAQFNHQHQR